MKSWIITDLLHFTKPDPQILQWYNLHQLASYLAQSAKDEHIGLEMQGLQAGSFIARYRMLLLHLWRVTEFIRNWEFHKHA